MPLLIYQTMVPMWSRAHRFSNVYAFAAIDVLCTILWLSAWASVASYVASGKGNGKNTNASGCDNFAYGSAAKCKESEATIILGVIVMMLFGITSYFSFRQVMHYKQTGEMPMSNMGFGKMNEGGFQQESQDAFSANIRHNEFDDEEHGVPQQTNAGMGISNQQYAPLHEAEGLDERPQPPLQMPEVPRRFNSVSPMNDLDTSYGGAGAYGRGPSPFVENTGYQPGPPAYGR